MLTTFLRSVFGPELYRVYKRHAQKTPGRYYEMNNTEYFTNTFISFFNGFCSLCKWSSPVCLAFAYSRSYFSVDYFYSLFNLALMFGSLLAVNYLLRAYGRIRNSDYVAFINKYHQVNTISKEASLEKKNFLSEYDFEMKGWNPEYQPEVLPNKFHNEQHKYVHATMLQTIKFNIWRLLSHICVDTFGLRMAYPGVILKNLIGKALIEGRSGYIEKKQAKRAIIRTACKYRNQIDTLFVDQRSNRVSAGESSSSSSRFGTISDFNDSDSKSNFGSETNGKTLVICCDGNASFYEVGCFQIPIEKGYSALGWNYPGFGESSGLPYPEQLTSAADAVMQYAFSLGFKSENIILFSWSIGGFACSWLSNQYPDTKAVVLDACFDNITPLAQQQMPKFASDFVAYTIKHTLNLNVAQLISNFNGPVIFIRRTQDEIISTVARHPSTNRGNNLLLKTLNTRYPYIFDNNTIPYIRTWLSAKSDSDRMRIINSNSVDAEKTKTILAEYIEENSSTYPINIASPESPISNDAKLTLAYFLADKYLINFESSHCIPLPLDYFVEPWTEKDLKRYSF